MSFFSDLFHGNFGNLGTDISHAPSSFAAHPAEWAPVAAGALGLGTAGLGLAGLGPLAGLGGAAEGGAGGFGGFFGLGGGASAGGAGFETAGAPLLSFADTADVGGSGFANELGLIGGNSAFSPSTYAGTGTDLFAGGSTLDATPISTTSVFAPDAGSAAGLATVSDAGDIIPAGTFSAAGAGLDPATAAYASSLGLTNTSSGIPLAALSGDPTVVGSFGGTGGGIGAGGGADALSLGGDFGGNSAIGDASVIGFGKGGGDASGGLFGGLGNWAKNNWLTLGGLGLGAGMLAKNLISPPTLPQQGNLTGIAQQAGADAASKTALGQSFLQPSLTGQLPAGLEAQVTQSLNDAMAATKAKFASLGLGNSTMAQDAMNDLQNKAEALRGTLAQQLAQTGTTLMSQATQDLSIESQIYSQLMDAQISQDNQLEQSISQFAGALAMAGAMGSRQNVTLKAA